MARERKALCGAGDVGDAGGDDITRSYKVAGALAEG